MIPKTQGKYIGTCVAMGMGQKGSKSQSHQESFGKKDGLFTGRLRVSGSNNCERGVRK